MDYKISASKHNKERIDLSPYHLHEYYEIICFVSGECNMLFGNQKIRAKTGDIVVVPPKMLHGAEPESEVHTIFMSGGVNCFSFDAPVLIKDNERGEGLFLARTLYDNRLTSDEYLNSLHRTLCEFILKNANLQDGISLAINKIISEISANFSECNFDLNTVLIDCDYAKDYIRTRFKKVTGKTPVEFLTEVRIEHAKQLIDTYKDALLLYEVAILSGFSDYVYFSRRFKKFTGLSPQEYKNSK